MKLKELHALRASLSTDVHEYARRQKRSIPLWELECIYRIITEVDFSVDGVVEIGTFLGWGTMHLAAAAEEHNVPLWTIDIDEQNQEDACEFVERKLLFTNVRWCPGDSLKVLVNQPFGGSRPNVWLIDGLHSYKNSKAEMEHALAVIGDLPGLLIFDDAHYESGESGGDGGVPRLMKEIEGVPVPGTRGRLVMLRVNR